MDHRSEVRNFLTSRRGRLTPEQAGVQFHGGQRRVKGLRREEVAMLATMSTDYYTRMERGDLRGASEAVLDALANALQLDEAERTHLFNLASAANAKSPRAAGRTRRASAGVREGVQRVLDTIQTPAYVSNQRSDVVAFNRMGRALFADVLGETGTSFNMVRFLFLDPRSREFFVQWEDVARNAVAALRSAAGSNPFDAGLTELVGQLSTRSEEFRTWWATYNVNLHRTATKTLHHSVVGDIELTGEALEFPADTGLRLIVYTAEPGSAAEHGLAFLASWSSVQHKGAPTATVNAPSRSGEAG